MSNRSLDSVHVIWRNVPLVGQPQEAFIIGRRSLLSIVRECSDRLPEQFEKVGVVKIDGQPIPSDLWRVVSPKPRAIVTFHLSVKNDLVRTLASIAIIVAAVVAGPEVVGLLGLTGTLATLTSAAVTGAIAIGGNLLLNALAPPPSNPANALNQSSSGVEIKAASLSGNTSAAGQNLPYVAGFRKLFPPFVCEPLIELVDDTEVVEGVYGLSGATKIDDIRIEDTPISQIQEILFETTEGFPNSTPQDLVTRQGKVVSPNTELSSHKVNTTTQNWLLDQGDPESDLPNWHRFVTRDSPDEYWISLNWAQGFYRSDLAGLAVAVRVRFRERGTTTWHYAPEIHFGNNQTNQFQKTIKLMWEKAPVVLHVPEVVRGANLAYTTVPAQTITPASGGYSADSYFYSGSGPTFYDSTNATTTGVKNVQLYKDRAEIYLDPAIYPKATYEVEIIRGQTYVAGQLAHSTYVLATIDVIDQFGYYFDTGPNQNRIVTDRSNIKDQMIVVRTSSVWNQYPVTPGAPIALIAVKARGRSIGQLSCMAGAYVPIPVNGVYGDTLSISTNPADHYREVLLGSRGFFQFDISQVDDLLWWRNNCDANGYTINAVIQGMKEMDVLTLFAAAGYAKPIQSETWGVTQDRDRTGEIPVQVFTNRNLKEFSWKRTFAPFTDGLRVKYDSAELSYIEDEIIVLDPDAMTGGQRLEDIRYETFVTTAAAEQRALYDLGQARKRLIFYSGTTYCEGLRCRRGDLVGVQHDVIDVLAGAGRVASVQTSGGNVIGLTLDSTSSTPNFGLFIDPLTFFNDPTLTFFEKRQRLGMSIRTLDGQILVKEVTTTQDDANVFTFVTPFANTGVIDEDCLVTIGILGTEYRRLLVHTIVPRQDLQADIVFVDEAASLFKSKVTTLLLHGDGPDNSTTIVDDSSYSVTCVASGHAKNVHPQKVFGAGSLHFDGVDSKIICTEQLDRFNSQVDFTVDFWFRTTTTSTGVICAKQTTWTPWMLKKSAGQLLFYAASSANSSFDIANGIVVGTYSLSTFTHVAIVHNGDLMYFFVNGILTFSYHTTLDYNYVRDGIELGVHGSTDWFEGHIDEFRYTNGLARWVVNFTPPQAPGTA